MNTAEPETMRHMHSQLHGRIPSLTKANAGVNVVSVPSPEKAEVKIERILQRPTAAGVRAINHRSGTARAASMPGLSVGKIEDLGSGAATEMPTTSAGTMDTVKEEKEQVAGLEPPRVVVEGSPRSALPAQKDLVPQKPPKALNPAVKPFIGNPDYQAFLAFVNPPRRSARKLPTRAELVSFTTSASYRALAARTSRFLSSTTLAPRTEVQIPKTEVPVAAPQVSRPRVPDRSSAIRIARPPPYKATIPPLSNAMRDFAPDAPRYPGSSLVPVSAARVSLAQDDPTQKEVEEWVRIRDEALRSGFLTSESNAQHSSLHKHHSSAFPRSFGEWRIHNAVWQLTLFEQKMARMKALEMAQSVHPVSRWAAVFEGKAKALEKKQLENGGSFGGEWAEKKKEAGFAEGLENGRSKVLNMRSIWNADQEALEEGKERAIWPSLAEMRIEGDLRAQHKMPRELCLPRLERASEAWGDRLIGQDGTPLSHQRGGPRAYQEGRGGEWVGRQRVQLRGIDDREKWIKSAAKDEHPLAELAPTDQLVEGGLTAEQMLGGSLFAAMNDMPAEPPKQYAAAESWGLSGAEKYGWVDYQAQRGRTG